MMCFWLRTEVSTLVCYNGTVSAQKINKIVLHGGLTYCQTSTHRCIYVGPATLQCLLSPHYIDNLIFCFFFTDMRSKPVFSVH